LTAGARILLVPFDPLDTAPKNAFTAYYGLSGPLPLFGPFDGKLSNEGGRIALEKPQAPDVPGEGIPWILVDEVVFSESAPWMKTADGLGYSLHRRLIGASAADPGSWIDAVPSPGGGALSQPDLLISGFEKTTNQFRMRFDLLPDTEYTLESTTNLLINVWQPYTSLINQTNCYIPAQTSGPVKFYRLKRD
ncbi:MAG: hypothetical protein MUC65_08995, partial [Pontiellaceae bacterium]|nr:hypothetical protein [Pontiellaceae bacterium]